MKSGKKSGVKSKKLKSIGLFSSENVGIQYYENRVNAGDIIHSDRNPHNEFDDPTDCGYVTGKKPLEDKSLVIQGNSSKNA